VESVLQAGGMTSLDALARSAAVRAAASPPAPKARASRERIHVAHARAGSAAGSPVLSCVNGAIHALEGALMFTEVNVVGQVVGASGISGAPSAHCIWRLAAGDKWQHMAGMSTGSTQCDSPAGSSGRFVWQHPVDARFVGAEMSGWPRLELEANAAPPTMARLLLRTIAAVREHSCCTVAIAQVRWVDAHGRSDLAGYALLCAARPSERARTARR